VLMDWDRRTQTGARTSGVEEATPRMVVHHRAHCPDTLPDIKCGHGVYEGQNANLHAEQGMPGAGLT